MEKMLRSMEVIKDLLLNFFAYLMFVSDLYLIVYLYCDSGCARGTQHENVLKGGTEEHEGFG